MWGGCSLLSCCDPWSYGRARVQMPGSGGLQSLGDTPTPQCRRRDRDLGRSRSGTQLHQSLGTVPSAEWSSFFVRRRGELAQGKDGCRECGMWAHGGAGV